MILDTGGTDLMGLSNLSSPETGCDFDGLEPVIEELRRLTEGDPHWAFTESASA